MNTPTSTNQRRKSSSHGNPPQRSVLAPMSSNVESEILKPREIPDSRLATFDVKARARELYPRIYASHTPTRPTKPMASTPTRVPGTPNELYRTPCAYMQQRDGSSSDDSFKSAPSTPGPSKENMEGVQAQHLATRIGRDIDDLAAAQAECLARAEAVAREATAQLPVSDFDNHVEIVPSPRPVPRPVDHHQQRRRHDDPHPSTVIRECEKGYEMLVRAYGAYYDQLLKQAKIQQDFESFRRYRAKKTENLRKINEVKPLVKLHLDRYDGHLESLREAMAFTKQLYSLADKMIAKATAVREARKTKLKTYSMLGSLNISKHQEEAVAYVNRRLEFSHAMNEAAEEELNSLASGRPSLKRSCRDPSGRKSFTGLSAPVPAPAPAPAFSEQQEPPIPVKQQPPIHLAPVASVKCQNASSSTLLNHSDQILGGRVRPSRIPIPRSRSTSADRKVTPNLSSSLPVPIPVPATRTKIPRPPTTPTKPPRPLGAVSMPVVPRMDFSSLLQEQQPPVPPPRSKSSGSASFILEMEGIETPKAFLPLTASSDRKTEISVVENSSADEPRAQKTPERLSSLPGSGERASEAQTPTDVDGVPVSTTSTLRDEVVDRILAVKPDLHSLASGGRTSRDVSSIADVESLPGIVPPREDPIDDQQTLDEVSEIVEMFSRMSMPGEKEQDPTPKLAPKKVESGSGDTKTTPRSVFSSLPSDGSEALQSLPESMVQVPSDAKDELPTPSGIQTSHLVDSVSAPLPISSLALEKSPEAEHAPEAEVGHEEVKEVLSTASTVTSYNANDEQRVETPSEEDTESIAEELVENLPATSIPSTGRSASSGTFDLGSTVSDHTTPPESNRPVSFLEDDVTQTSAAKSANSPTTGLSSVEEQLPSAVSDDTNRSLAEEDFSSSRPNDSSFNRSGRRKSWERVEQGTLNRSRGVVASSTDSPTYQRSDAIDVDVALIKTPNNGPPPHYRPAENSKLSQFAAVSPRSPRSPERRSPVLNRSAGFGGAAAKTSAADISAEDDDLFSIVLKPLFDTSGPTFDDSPNKDDAELSMHDWSPGLTKDNSARSPIAKPATLRGTQDIKSPPRLDETANDSRASMVLDDVEYPEKTEAYAEKYLAHVCQELWPQFLDRQSGAREDEIYVDWHDEKFDENDRNRFVESYHMLMTDFAIDVAERCVAKQRRFRTVEAFTKFITDDYLKSAALERPSYLLDPERTWNRRSSSTEPLHTAVAFEKVHDYCHETLDVLVDVAYEKVIRPYLEERVEGYEPAEPARR